MKRFLPLFAAVALLGTVLVQSLPLMAAGTNLVTNPSLATVSPTSTTTPANWQSNKWGTNTTTLTYKTNSGRTDSTSTYTQITKYTNGDAKWFFNNVAVKPNTKYTFSDYSKSNVQTKLTAQYVSTTGALSYVDLATVAASSTNWAQKTVTFTTPANVKEMSVYHLIAKVGWLQTDDFSLVDNSVATTNPTVALTAPTAGSTVSKTTTLAANANGGSGTVSGVQFKVDGVNAGAEDTTAPYTFGWDTTKVTDGSHSVSATVRNSLNTSATSTAVNVTVSNPVVVVPPTIAFTSPADGATVNKITTVSANASDSKGLAGVTFKLDGVAMATEDTTAPYDLNWDTTVVADGQHTLTATARGTSNATTTSTIKVNVSNPVVIPPAPISENLVLNSSVETGDPASAAKPDQWTYNSWGTNTASFVYPITGNTSSRAVRINMTAYTSGDAKWIFNPVAVSANTTYRFQDNYRSNIVTSVVAQFTDAAGAVSYVDLGSLPASATWTAAEFNFTTKANTASISVFHLISQVGFLEQDDASVAKVEVPSSSNPIPNSSLELASGTQPANWTASKWGTNTASFQYMNEGHTGSRSAKVTVSNYTDGDAKWLFNPITSLEKGKQYRWSTWYKTNTTPHAVAAFTRADGTEKFFGMPQPFPQTSSATSWAQYSDTFTVPQDAVSVTVFLFVASNGWVQVDDQSITPYQPAGWNRPMVSLTFDDGYEDNISNALPVMNQYGFKSTQCYNTTDLKADPAMGKKALDAFMSAGHEICSHTSTHPFLTKLTSGQLTSELADSKAYLEQLSGQPVVDFASPYGDYNEAVNTEIKKYYQSHRTVDEGYNSKDNFDPYRLRVQNMTPATTLTEFNGWLAQAKADNTWLVLVYHDVVNTNPSPYGSYTADFQQQMAALNASGLTVLTYKDSLAEAKSQL